MKINKEITLEGEATLEIEIPVEETGDAFSEALRKFQQEVKIPGFRPGRVPMNLIRKRWGRDILTEKAEELARKNLVEALKQEELEPGGQIMIDLIEFGEDKPLRYKASFPMRPEVKLTNYKELRVLVNDTEVADKDIDEQVEAHRRKLASLRSIDEPAPPEAKLILKVQEVDPSGLPLIGRTIEDREIELGMDELGIGSDEQLLGIKANNKRLVHVHRRIDGLAHAPIKSAIITPGEAGARNGATEDVFLSVEAVRVEVPELPEVNDDFAGLVNEKLKNLEELRNWIKFNLYGYIETIKTQMIDRGIIDRLIEENPFTFSRSFIDSTLNTIAEDLDFDDDDERQRFLDQHREDTEKDLRWVLLRDKIAEVENLKVTDEELDNEIVRIAEQTGDTIETVKSKLQKDETLDRLKNRMFERNVVEFLKSNAQIETRMMDLNEFLRLATTSEDNK